MFSNKLKKLFGVKQENEDSEEKDGNNKRKIENLVFFVILLIITIVIINVILNENKNTNEQNNNTSSKKLASNTSENQTIETSSSGNEMESKLQEILKKIQGVGEVNVFINYSESSETIPMYNENAKISQTEEADTSGGTRKIAENSTEKEIIYQENSGEKTPITQKIINPKIEGAIITAKGAGDINVKSKIIQAVEAVTGLASHKIQVFEME